MVTDFWQIPDYFGRIPAGPQSRAAELGSAAVFYGSFGLLDPKMPFEAAAFRRYLGWRGIGGLAGGAGVSMGIGILIAASLGLIFDPAHKVDDWGMDDYQGKPYGDPFSETLDDPSGAYDPW